MVRNLKATCNCGREIRPIKTGVYILVQTDFGQGPEPYQLYKGDVHGCTKCGTQFAVLNNSTIAEHFEDDFNEALSAAKKTGFLWIQSPTFVDPGVRI